MMIEVTASIVRCSDAVLAQIDETRAEPGSRSAKPWVRRVLRRRSSSVDPVERSFMSLLAKPTSEASTKAAENPKSNARWAESTPLLRGSLPL